MNLALVPDYKKPLNLRLVEPNESAKIERIHAQESQMPLMLRHFGNVATVKEHDRLDGLLLRVKKFMASGRWHTLQEIAEGCGCSETSASARLRDLRKVGFGSHQTPRKERSPNLWEYRWVINWKTEKDIPAPTFGRDLRDAARKDGVRGEHP